jgi:hypothetical protein
MSFNLKEELLLKYDLIINLRIKIGEFENLKNKKN